jgi:ABC-type transport system involved in cytochrome c biogenesis permease component
MSRFPIVTRELRVRARMNATHRLRCLAAGAVLLMAMAMLPATARISAGGQHVFHWLTGFAMLFCLVEGMRTTADCVSREKREGTLGLLFLTDLSGADVVLGKLVAVSLNSIYGLLAIIPVLALPLLLGGVTFGECARVVLVLLNTLFFSLCLGLWVSTRRYEHARCVMETFGLLAAFLVLPLLLDLPFTLTGAAKANSAVFSFLSPVIGYLAALDVSSTGGRTVYWSSLAALHAISWGFLVAASLTAVRSSRVTPFNQAKTQAQEKVQPSRVGEQHPIQWLVLRYAAGTWWVWVLAMLSITVSGWQLYVFRIAGSTGISPSLQVVSQVVHGLIALAFKLAIVTAACRCLAQARANGALELLLTTPLSVPEFLQNHARAVWRTLRVLLLVRIILLLWWPLAWFVIFRPMTSPVSMPTGLFVSMLSQIVILVADMWTAIWVGTWLAVHSARHSTAVIKTLLYVYVLPWLAMTALSWAFLLGLRLSFTWVYVALIIVKDVVLLRWARRRLATGFRQAAAELPTSAALGSAWRNWTLKKWTGLPACAKASRPSIDHRFKVDCS